MPQLDPQAPFEVSPEVSSALKAGRGVVALESAVLTHGLPAEAAARAVSLQKEACAGEGALAAVVGVVGGRLRAGLSEGDCADLARHPDAGKASTWNLASLVLRPGYGGTTVAATVRAARLAGILVMATGGLGGVHRGSRLDISADLGELASSRVCVVCSGPKSILDVPATVELLETMGIPLVGWRSDRVAGFLSPLSEVPVAARVESLPDLASLVESHWRLGGGGLVVSRPLEEERAISREAMARALQTLGGAEAGGRRTPADLERLRAVLGPAAIEANLALLESNARLAAALAVRLAEA